MMSKINILFRFAFFLLFTQSLCAQKGEDTSIYNKFVNQTLEVNGKFHVYNPPFKAKPIMRTMAEAKNRYPEELMISIISERDYAWLNYNTTGESREKTQRYFKQKVAWDKDSVYYALSAKLEFTKNGEEYAYMRFRFHSDDDAPLGIYLLKKVGSRWYYTREVLSIEVSFALMIMKPEILAKFFKGEKTGEAIFDNMLTRVSKNGVLDLEILAKEVGEFYPNEKEKAKKAYFLEPLNW